MSLTGRELAEKLLSSRNPDAVVALSVDEFTYSAIDGFYDDSQPDDGDGVIGNLLLKLDPESEIGKYLADDEEKPWTPPNRDNW